MLLRYEYFVCIPHSLKLIMGCHGNHKISYNRESIYFEDNISLHLSGPNEQIYTHEMSYVFNLGLITPLHTIVNPYFTSFLRFH